MKILNITNAKLIKISYVTFMLHSCARSLLHQLHQKNAIGLIMTNIRCLNTTSTTHVLQNPPPTSNISQPVPPQSATQNSPTLPSALDLIRSQPSQYVIASFLGRRYILAPRDVLTVPHVRDLNVGDTIALTDILELGSREYTLRGTGTLGAVKVEAVVIEHTKGSMEYIFKKKRRKGYKRTIQHKQGYTRLRIGGISF